MINKEKWYSSSMDPQSLSLTIRGMLVMYIPLIITLGDFFGYSLTENAVSDLITSISFGVAILMIAWGILRKIYSFLRKNL